jgi:hypothetical protein
MHVCLQILYKLSVRLVIIPSIGVISRHLLGLDTSSLDQSRIVAIILACYTLAITSDNRFLSITLEALEATVAISIAVAITLALL